MYINLTDQFNRNPDSELPGSASLGVECIVELVVLEKGRDVMDPSTAGLW